MNPADPTHPVPVAIIGMGCLFPKAESLSDYWSNIRNRVDAIGDVPETHWRPEDYFDADPKAPDRTYARRGGFLSPVDFPPLDFGIAPNNLDATDTTQLLGLMVARQALEDAGYGEGSTKPLDRGRVSVILGVTGTLELVIPLGARLGHPIWRRALKASGVPEGQAEEVVKRIADSYVGWQENSFPGLLGNVAAGRIANRLDLGGTNCVIDAACASSVGAVNLAILELAAGRCDLALTGGLDTFNDIFMYMCFSKTPALSPTGDARPFDASCDGTILGEGLGILALKRLDDARRDGDTVYAVIKSVGTSSDGKGNAVYAPSASGQARALKQAYAIAGTPADTIDLIEAHGTGTKVGDATELKALTEVYREAKADGTWCALGSVKSQIGHTKAAAGAAGLIKAALALHHKVLPPTIKIDRPLDGLSPGQSPFYVNTEARPWLPRSGHPRRAAVSAFGFGGSNYHCVLEEAEPVKASIDWDGNTQILAFSAESRDALVRALEVFPEALSWNAFRTEAAHSRGVFRNDSPYRLTIVVGREDDREAIFAKARTVASETSGPRVRDSIFFGSGPKPGKLAMLFPGQGSQYVGMFRELACLFPQVQETLAQADEAMGSTTANRLSDRLYPFPVFSDAERAVQEEALRETAAAQPAIGAVSLGLFQILSHFGVHPDMVAGHSFGELTALCAGGWIDQVSFATLAHDRGRLMAEAAAKGGGAMLAVLAALDVIESVLRDESLDLVIANKNGPRQFVLSGRSAEIQRASEAFEARNITARSLAVSAAFHSPNVAGASVPFLASLEQIDITPQMVPVYSNTTAAIYPSDAGITRDLLAGQITRPVEFVAEIQAMAASGAGVFLEVGPDAKLTGLVRSILETSGAGDRPTTHAFATAVDISRGSRGNISDLAAALAELAAFGYPMNLNRWDDDFLRRIPPVRKPGLTVKVSGANARPRPSSECKPATSLVAKPGPLSAAPPTPTPVIRPPMTPTPSRSPSSPAQPAVNGEHAARSLSNGSSHNGRHQENGSHPVPAAPIPMFVPIGPSDPRMIAQALKNAQENLVALQRISEQTADLHRHFLEGQDRSQRTFQSLLEQQQKLTLASFGVTIAPTLPLPTSDASQRRSEPAPAAIIARRRAPAPQPAAPRIVPTSPVLKAAAVKNPNPVPAAVKVSDRGGRVQSVLLDVVAEKTGYPAEMLELNMQLDADLGIDSIKRVEILSALQERLPDAPAVKPEHLGTLRTLKDIADFLAEGTAVVTASATPPTPVEPSRVPQVLLEVVAEKTGYPAEMLDLSMQLDADLGIDSIKRVEILSALQERLPDAPAVRPEHLGTLRTLKDIADFLAETHGTLDQKHADSKSSLMRFEVEAVRLGEHTRAADAVIKSGGEIVVTDDGTRLSAMVVDALAKRGYRASLLGWNDISEHSKNIRIDGLVLIDPARSLENTTINLDALRWLRATGPGLRQSGRTGPAAFITVSRLDGAFGLRDLSTHPDPSAGGLAGLSKTAGREWPEVSCKAIDLDPALELADEAVTRLVDEILFPGPAEVGITAEGRNAPGLQRTEVAIANAKPIQPGDVVVITGGARGVTAEVAVALAEAFHPTLVLLGRTPSPHAEPPWLNSLEAESEIKRALASQANGRNTPQLIGDQYKLIAANREILRNLARIQAAGGKALYHQVDVRDTQAVAAAINEVRLEYGPIRGVVHGAGVLADRRIEDKTDEQFSIVYKTKVDGFHALLDAVGSDELRVIGVFSSTTARFGRTGQVAYAAANEVLNKLAQREARRRPNCRVVAVNWGPWDGGMVSPGLKPLFESEGIGLIPLREGALHLVSELRADPANAAVEVVILGPNSTLPEPPTVTNVQSTPAVISPEPLVPSRAAHLTAVFSRTLDVDDLPILRSHVIDGRAVLPTALMLEWLAQGAIQRNPGLTFHGIDDLRVLKGAVVHDDRPETVAVLAGKALRDGVIYRVPVELRGELAGGKNVIHARGDVILGNRSAAAEGSAIVLGTVPPYTRSTRSVYHDILFHGPDLHGLERIDACAIGGIIATAKTAPEPSAWVDRPLRQSWLTDPLVLDSAFQLMVLWCHENAGGASLPTALGSYRQFVGEFPEPRVRIVARVDRPSESRATADIDFLDAEGNLVARIEGYECVIDGALHAKFHRNRLPQVTRGPR